MTQPPGYRRLNVWQHAMDLTDRVYELTEQFPTAERFGLISQMQRAAVSIPSNIAEGYARGNDGDYRRHIAIARGSLAELETQIEIALRRNYCTRDQIRETWSLAQSTGKMLTQLYKKLV